MSESALPADPLTLFAGWFADVHASGLAEPNAMVLATASGDGVPSARLVLLKGYGPRGFRFFTNLTSHKGRDLAENPRAELVFPWHPLHRQVRVAGPVAPLSREETAAYFRTRPYGSRLGAWASEHQSGVIPDRDVLERRFAAAAERWPAPARPPGAPEDRAPEDSAPEGETPDADAADTDAADAVPLPDFWGGYRVVPTSIEFWQGRVDRLHDRLRYRRPETSDTDVGWTEGEWTEDVWTVERLSP